jgi:dTDP-4-dehydrorhamnose reductase
MTRILLTGRDGQVGRELHRMLGTLGEIVAPSRQELDLSEPASIREAVRGKRPQWIVNAAAYTAVDRAESEPDLAMAVNGRGPGILAEEARRIGAALIHYSTDYVFDGTKADPYTEDDAPNPLNAYGRSKLAGDEAIRAAGAPYLILRTSWVYAARGTNFLLTVLRLAQEQDELRIVDDQVGAPTWSRHVAGATVHILGSLVSRGGAPALGGMSGVYNLSAAGAVSWFGFAEEILQRAQPGAVPGLTPISSSDYRAAATRPRNSRLCCDRLRSVFGVVMPDWKTQLSACLQELGIGSIHTGAAAS